MTKPNQESFDSISICSGVFAGMVTVTMPRDIYEAKDGASDTIIVREKSFFQDPIPSQDTSEFSEKSRHWEPLSSKSAHPYDNILR
jgi:hypothetical protein